MPPKCLRRVFFLSFMGLAGAMPALAQQASPPFDPLAFELNYAAADGPEARLEMLAEAVTQLERAENPDLRVYFDLNLLRIDELEEAGELQEAARLAAQVVGFARAQGAALGLDPMPLYARAAGLAEKAGNLRIALRVMEEELSFRQSGGQSGEELATVIEEMARIAGEMGDTARAEKLETAAAETREAKVDSATKSATDAGGYREVEVFYATDRARTGETAPAQFYGAGRGDLDYGSLMVTIPDVHVPGAIEAPSVWRLEFAPNPAKHVMLQSITPLEKDAFFDSLNAEVTGRERKEAFVFIHGFNVRFDAAAKRAAQLAYDMNYRGVPVLYSWPSAGRTVNYVADTAVVRLSGRRLSGFLEDVHARSGADVVHIVAHSMGNRALTDALELLAARKYAEEMEEPMFGQVFFAAPDVDAGLFVEMTKMIRPLAERLTLYASEQDWALATSRKLHGNAPRAGQAGADILQQPHFDTVDMSDLGEDMLAHSYFANDSSALVDIMALVWRNPAPAQRCGISPLEMEVATSGEGAWKYEKGGCNVQQMMGILANVWQRPEVSVEDVRALIADYVENSEDAAALEAQFMSLLGKS